MEAVATRREERLQKAPGLALLLADDDAALRALMADRARELVDKLAVLQAADGAEAIQLGLQRRPQIALLDVSMPRLGGVEAALTLRELQPQIRLALQTGDTRAYRDTAREHRLPLFDKGDLELALAWLGAQAKSYIATQRPVSLARVDLECAVCGYGIAPSSQPERCPMCQSTGVWVPGPWRPFTRQRSGAVSMPS